MELKYVVMTIIKILISVPAVLLLHSMEVNGAALMGGHYDNKNNSSSTNLTNSYLIDYDVYDSQEQQSNNNSTTTPTTATNLENKHNNTSENVQNSEQVPNPSPLVVPGYNLPENIFNKGKPFYLEKDPLTGHIDFNSKSSVKLDDDLYDYVDDEPNDNIYDKSNIDRKDGSLNEQQQQHHHRPSDVNQLTPNFHDFLNLPVKYNSDKYVYPLISSSYANTKIQGNVNKYQNHKNYNVKTSTEKPTVSPTYYSSTNKNYFNPHLKTTTKRPELTTTATTTTTSTTTKRTTTGKPTSLLTGAMGHPSFNEDFEYDYYETTKKQLKPNEIYLTTENVNNIYLTSKATSTTTTKRPMSLFEQLFGEYEDEEAVTERTKPPPLFVNLPSNKNTMNKFDGDIKTENQSNFTTPNGQNVLTGTNMGLESSYEYEDDYSNGKHEDSIAVETRPVENNTTIIVANSSSSSQIEHKMPNEYIDEKEEEYSSNNTDYSEYDYQENVKYSTPSTTTTTIKVTSLPLGENHVTGLNNRQPIIVATQNLKEKLNSEKISTIIQHAPSTSNIHIAPDQDTVSFVVGNHQNVDGGQYVGTSLKESPYDSNPFRPLFGQEATYSNQDSVSYKIHAGNNQETIRKPIQNYPEIGGASSVTIQPLKNSEASLAIGVPVNNVKQVPGQVVDEKLDIKNEQIQFPKGNGPKIIFPDDKESADSVPATIKSPQKPQLPPPNREVLQLASQPMYHQLPSDLTPPKEQIIEPPKRIDRPRPPWDPRPGHFYSGKPEYARPARPPPPRSPSPTEYKRIDNLPNILPQFRPNMKMNGPPPPPPQHYFDKLVRQPLLERPSNRPIGFFEKLQPPPPPLSHNFHNLRKIQQQQPLQSLDDPHNIQIAEDRIMNDGPKKADQFDFYHTPPKVPIANRRHANDGEVETLQMIQAKNVEKRDFVSVVSANNSSEKENGTEKPLYVVYPVNANPVKLNTIDNNRNKEAVVVGTRAELPLPPSKINKNFIYEQNPLLNPKDRSDSPVLKPHPRPSTFPIKSDFPYPLERPDPASIHPAVPETPSNNGNNLDEPLKFDEPNPTSFVSNNQWNTIGEQIESRIVTGSKLNSNQISVTLKTYTEKPIAVAYTPTAEPALYDFNDKFSMPNYGSIVIPEIRKGTVNNDQDNGEFTVSAVMHTRLQSVLGAKNNDRHAIEGGDPIEMNHKIIDSNPPPTQLDFQAPFQASVSIDSVNQGWSVVRDKNKTTTEETAELTTVPIATTSEFDIENFKPELIGGFKPIYNFPDDERRDHENINEREE